jgi:hypothetical protein
MQDNPYQPLGLKANVTKLETELKENKVWFDRMLGSVTKKLEKLKLSEQHYL